MAGKSDNFWGGVLLGTLVGATVGAVVALKLTQQAESLEEEPPLDLDTKDIAYTLEEKIAQLNAAIDAVSAELGTANGQRRVQM